MSSRTPQTRYGFPPARDPFEPFPSEVPWDTPIHELSSWWLTITCAGCGWYVGYPLRLMAAERGWNLTLRRIVPKLVCKNCGAKPSGLRLHKDGAGDSGRAGYEPPSLDLLT